MKKHRGVMAFFVAAFFVFTFFAVTAVMAQKKFDENQDISTGRETVLDEKAPATKKKATKAKGKTWKKVSKPDESQEIWTGRTEVLDEKKAPAPAKK